MAKKITYYVLLVLVSALFLFSSYAKLTGNPAAAASFTVAHLPLWFMYFIGTCEALGAIGLWLRPTRVWAAAGLSVILVGAVTLTAIYVSALEALFPLITGIVVWIVVCLGKRSPAPASSPSQPAA